MHFYVSTPTGARTIDIEPSNAGRYAVLVSGGIDSAVLLSAMMIARSDSGNTWPTLVTMNVQRGVGTERFSASMVARISSYFGQPIEMLSLPLPPDTPHYDCLRVPVVPMLDAGKFDYVFSADTSNPPFYHPQAPVRTPVAMQHAFPRWRLPFLHCDKTHIVALMYDLGLSFIEKESHTCFALDEFRCNSCFQCQERAWAYSTLGRVDTGQH